MKKISIRLSYLLRHSPALPLQYGGWAKVDEVIELLGPDVTFDQLKKIVASDSKQRYSFNGDKSKIRANQGHSVDVTIDFKSASPPHKLYHGTSKDFLDSILKTGLNPKSRQYVHLSPTEGIAQEVAKRRKNPIILEVDAKLAYFEKTKFWISENNVWLAEHIKPKYLKKL